MLNTIPADRQEKYVFAMIDIWLPLLMKGEIGPEEFRAFLAESFLKF